MNKNKADALLVHIEHSKPIEVSDFVTTLNAVGNLFSIFAQGHGDTKDISNAKLYVEKIEEGCIDIILCETVTAGILPFMENMNIIFEFSSYIKDVISYYTKGHGKKPKLGMQECKNFKDLFTVTSGDNNGEMTIGAIFKGNKGNIYHNCTFNFPESNSAQNQIAREISGMKEVSPTSIPHKRVLMQIYQLRNDSSSNTGNKAIIDDIFRGKKLSVVFESDDLRSRILFSDENPAIKAFLVDVVVQTIDGRPAAYKVLELHDVIDL